MTDDEELILYYHPFASFCQKALIALYEREVPFTRRLIDLGDAEQRAELQALWPFARFPVLQDARTGRTVVESSIVIEYLDRRSPGAPPMIPADPDAALDARLWDRICDLNVAASVTKMVVDTFRAEGERDGPGVELAWRDLRLALDLVEARMAGREWIAGDAFSLADCSAAPALFYAAWVEPYRDSRPAVWAYLQRLLVRPSVARVVEEARPYRGLFPLRNRHPAPERDG